MTQVLGRAVESLVMQPWHLPSVLSAFDRLPAYDLVIGARTGARLVAGADEVGLACLAGRSSPPRACLTGRRSPRLTLTGWQG